MFCFEDPNNIIPTPPTVPPKLHDCPNEFVPYGISCYKLLQEENTWSDARAACVETGGDLASIHNGSDNAAVFYEGSTKINQPIWIGLRQDNVYNCDLKFFFKILPKPY